MLFCYFVTKINGMTEFEYFSSGHHSKSREFTLVDSRKIYGVVSPFFENDNSFYFLPNNNLLEFLDCTEKNNHERIKELVSPIKLSDILSIKEI